MGQNGKKAPKNSEFVRLCLGFVHSKLIKKAQITKNIKQPTDYTDNFLLLD